MLSSEFQVCNLVLHGTISPVQQHIHVNALTYTHIIITHAYRSTWCLRSQQPTIRLTNIQPRYVQQPYQ